MTRVPSAVTWQPPLGACGLGEDGGLRGCDLLQKLLCQQGVCVCFPGMRPDAEGACVAFTEDTKNSNL